MQPNREALESYSKESWKQVSNIQNPTHGTLAGAIADEKLIPSLSKIIKMWVEESYGVQCGLETGSIRLIGKYADRKLAPFKPSEWHWVVKEGVKTLNEYYWYLLLL